MAAPPMPDRNDRFGTDPARSAIELFAGAAPDAVMTAVADLHGRAFDKGWSRQSLERLLGTPGCAMATIRSDGHIAGFVLFRSDGAEAEIVTLAVDPGRRRRGLATLLVSDLLDWARQSSVGRLHLEVACDNVEALALYEKLGFSESARRKNYYKSKNSRGRTVALDAICMTQNVNNALRPGG